MDMESTLKAEQMIRITCDEQVCAILLICVFAGRRLHSVGETTTGTVSFERGSDVGSGSGQTACVSAPGTYEAKDNGLVDAGAEILERYEKTPGCTLVHAGYIDLFGNVWACLVAGPGWAELSVVRVGQDGTATTSVAHIDSPRLPVVGGDAS